MAACQFVIHYRSPIRRYEYRPIIDAVKGASLKTVYILRVCCCGPRIALSVHRFPTGWAVRGSNTGGGKRFSFLHTRLYRPWGPPSLVYSGYWSSFPGAKRPRCGVGHSHRLCLRGILKGNLYICILNIVNGDCFWVSERLVVYKEGLCCMC